MPWLVDVAKTATVVAALCIAALFKTSSGSSAEQLATLPLLAGGVDAPVSDPRVPELALAYEPHPYAAFLEQVAQQTPGSAGANLVAYALKSSPAHLQFGAVKPEGTRYVVFSWFVHLCAWQRSMESSLWCG